MKKKLVIFLAIILIISSFLISTETFAFLVDYHPDLGEKHFDIVYEPFHIIYWYITIEVEGSDAFLISFAVLLILLSITTIFCLWLYIKTNIQVSDTCGSARYLKTKELKKLGSLSGGGCILAQTYEATFIRLTKHKKNETLDNWIQLIKGKFIFENSKNHIMGVAPTRKGKGINLIIPSLLNWIGSTVVIDIKKENYTVTGGWRGKFSHVLRFEPFSDYSPHWNPLLEMTPGHEEVGQAQNVAEILTNDDTIEDHWKKTTKQFFCGLILYVLYFHPLEKKSLAGMYEFINNPEMTFRESLELMLKSGHKIAAQTARNMLNKADPELSSVVSSASTYLQLFQDPIVAKNTSTSDFCIDQIMFHKNPVSLYIVIEPTDLKRSKPLLRILLQMIGRHFTKNLGNPRNHKLLMLCDEFPSLGKMPYFEELLAYGAGYGIKCMLIGQSFSQFDRLYSKDNSLIDNLETKVILGANSIQDSERISKLLGNQTILKTNTSKSVKSASLLKSNESISTQEISRPLMTADEVRRLRYDKVLVINGGTYPYLAKKIFYYQDSRFKNRINLKTPDSKEEQDMELIPFSIPWYNLDSFSAIQTQNIEIVTTEKNEATNTLIDNKIKSNDEVEMTTENDDDDFIDDDFIDDDFIDDDDESLIKVSEDMLC